MLARARSRGLSYLAFTDHNDIPTFSFEGEGIVRGVEVDVLDREYVGHTVHELVYGLSAEQHRDIMTIAALGDIREFSEYCNLAGLWLCYAHPFWAKGQERLNPRAIPRVARLNHFIEVNEGVSLPQNRAARRLARALRMPELANSDTHTAHPGATFTLARGETFPEWIENVRRGDYHLRVCHMNRAVFRAEVRRWLELAFCFEPQSPDAREEVKHRRFWGVRAVDRFLHSVITGRLSRLPRTRETLWHVARMLLKAGASDPYVLSEIRKGLRMENFLRDGEVIRRLALAPDPARRTTPAVLAGPGRRSAAAKGAERAGGAAIEIRADGLPVG
jgi:hypothetical protein